ncbi:MAG: NUDIX hydrolase [Actinobacteria bacterium]|nr:NUDIX hydrolase [Actinomycetota bacterium]
MGLMDEQDWYASLATMYGSAAALIADSDGPSPRFLLVKPNYRDHWSLPGGILEHGEPPHVGCFREVEEELGLAREVGALLVTAWTPPEGPRPRPIMSFIFDGGVLTDPGTIRLQKEELDDWRFVPPSDFDAYLPAFMAERVRAAATARATGKAAYVPAESPLS